MLIERNYSQVSLEAILDLSTNSFGTLVNNIMQIVFSPHSGFGRDGNISH